MNNNINEILALLDWNCSQEDQKNGIFLAKKTGNIRWFIQPVTPPYSKNVWENCAKVICSYSDFELLPYLNDLISWLQDFNWPGAFLIFQRLSFFENKIIMKKALEKSFEKAVQTKDDVWQNNIQKLMLTFKNTGDNSVCPTKN